MASRIDVEGDAPPPGFTRGRPPWVHGLRTGTFARRAEWVTAYISYVVQGEFSNIFQGERTRQAEDGLGIPRSCYWYVGRAEGMYGEAIFLSEAGVDLWQDGDGGLSPFDSGGLWWGKVHTRPHSEAGSTERRQIFQRRRIGLAQWDERFRDYIKTHYSEFSAYVHSAPPENVDDTYEIICGPPNHPVAWTWEAHVASHRVGERISTKLAFMDENTLDRVFDDIASGEWGSMDRVSRWLQANARVPETLESPVTRANAEIRSLHE